MAQISKCLTFTHFGRHIERKHSISILVEKEISFAKYYETVFKKFKNLMLGQGFVSLSIIKWP